MKPKVSVRKLIEVGAEINKIERDKNKGVQDNTQ